MRTRSAISFTFHVAVAALFLPPALASAQTTTVAARITQAIDETKLTTLRGNTHPLARAEFDRGAAPSSLPTEHMLLVLKRSAEQESALETLLEQQQDASSPNFHKWLMPQQFGQQFGPSDQDIQTITSWLQSHGFQVANVSNGRTVIELSGTAGQVQEAFHTMIHKYVVNGEERWANSSDPQIPVALAPVVAGIVTLHNFPRHAMHHIGGEIARSRQTGALEPLEPLFTFGGLHCGVPGLNCYGLGPYDFATIYNVSPLWNAAPTHIDGTGQVIAVVGESDINIDDIRDFRNIFGLPANDPQFILDGPDPGTVPGDETESTLDVEWTGAVAKGATIDFVISQSTEVSLGVDLSAQYIVDNNLAPIISESYGICELFLGNAGNQFYSSLWQQAAAQGITALVATGDSGSAVCDRNAGTQGAAQFGLSVSGFSSTPYNVAVGGTDFNDLTDVSTYWSATNSVPPGAPAGTPATVSALSYIPETTWNNSCTNAVFGNLLGFSANPETNCNNAQLQQDGFVVASGGSGGKSSCIAGDGKNPGNCTQGYSKPAWQTALTPNDDARDVPDVSLFAAVGSPSGAFYLICEADITTDGYTSCQASDPNTHYIAAGGTSASTPVFAGIMALINQATGSRQGNANYVLYKLAAASGASCNSSNGAGTNCVFYDTTNGTIAMPCVKGSPNCNVSNQSDSVGVLSGYATTSGYDLATGLGSVNANNLVTQWKNFSLTPSSTTLTLNSGNPVNITHGQSVNVRVGVTGTGGTPSGSVSLIANEGPNGAAGATDGVQGFTLNSSGVASGSTTSLPGGSYSVVARYAGDGTFASSTSAPPIAVNVAAEASKVQIAYELFDPTTGALTNQSATTAAYGMPSLLRVNVTSQAGDACPNNAPGNMGCPTGNITLTDSYNGGSGAPLDGGTFALNVQGYTEDQVVDLLGGTHSLAATYAGDNSFTGSSGNATITITKAPTTTKAIFNPPVQTLVIGAPAAINGMTNSQSLGVAPTGNFTVLDGNTAVGTNVVLGFPGSQSTGALCQGLVNFSIGPPSGQHTLTVQYSGDNNYASSTSSAVTINAVYSITASMTANPNSVIYGSSVTITATFDTGNPATNAALKPTGTVSLQSSYGPITPVTTTVTQDATGNWVLQGTATTTPQQSESVYANYSGDANYESLSSPSVPITVTIPDFSVSPNPPSLTITAGQTGTTTLTITPTTNYQSTVALSCGGVGYVIPGATCTFSPSSVTLANGTSATTSFSLSTPPPSSNTTAMDAPIGMRGVPFVSTGRGTWWALGALSGLASLLLLAMSGKPRYRYCGLGLALLCGLSFAAGCGGGGNGGSGGGGGGGNGPVPTTTALSTPTTKVASGVGLTLTATVNSSKPTTGTVTFSSQSCGFSSSVNLSNGTAQVQLAPAVAICDVTARYSGDANNQPSQSGSLNIVFTGTAGQTVTAHTSADVHSIQINVTLQ